MERIKEILKKYDDMGEAAKALRDAGLVISRSEGRRMFVQLRPKIVIKDERMRTPK